MIFYLIILFFISCITIISSMYF